jgi:hypothetical protein
MMTANTLISLNLPSVFMHRFEEFELNQSASPFEGETVLESAPILLEPGAIVVDNEDSGFKVYNPSTQSVLKRWLGRGSVDEEEYVGMRFWRAPEKWVATTGSDYYGSVVQSVHFTRAGAGERKVAWNAKLSDRGQYDIYTYVGRMRRMGRGRGRDGQQQPEEQYHYFIYHDDGMDETVLDLNNATDGWNFLGTFYLSPDSAKVELTNESDGRIVMADAIKWVRR